MEYRCITHPFEPLFDGRSQCLILGTLPSAASREDGFYYGHRRNRFWQVMAALCGAPAPETTEAKRRLLLENRIALWDVVYRCEIRGSDDGSIRAVTPTDLRPVLAASRITRIYANGAKAAALYNRYQKKDIGRDIAVLPSTSPANAAWSLERLCAAWRAVTEPGGAPRTTTREETHG